MIAVPSDKPVQADVSFTSGFGFRSDPFHAGAAMHPGIDLAGAYGTPIYATADGTVLRAGWNAGGYGNLVEVDHGRGITTRYGHMSAILVSAGQHITRGQQIGRMGSTGRSTGNHLHYEVRIDGRAVNPIPFMKSTDYVLAMQRRSSAASMDAVAHRRTDQRQLRLPRPRRSLSRSRERTQISLTENAARRVAWIAERQSKPAILRLAVDGGGCAGFTYKFELGRRTRGRRHGRRDRRRQAGRRSGQPRPGQRLGGRFRRGPRRRGVQGHQSQCPVRLRLRIELLVIVIRRSEQSSRRWIAADAAVLAMTAGVPLTLA